MLRGTRVIEALESGVVPYGDAVGGSTRAEPAKTASLTMDRGDVFVGLNGGGGGVGDPLDRDPAAVAADVRDGYVTTSHAADVYGVVLAADGTADAAATVDRRGSLRARRLDRPPTRTAIQPTTTGTLRVVDGSWRCVACDATLAAADANWRSGAVVDERSVHDALTARGMFVRPAHVDRPPVLRTHCCPGCATQLAVDLTLEGRPEVPAARPGIVDPWPHGEHPAIG